MGAVRRRAEVEHSGRLLLRMPRALHGELAAAAEREGVSLNRLIVTRLSGSLSPEAPAEPRRRPRRTRLVDLALAVNFVVVVAAGAVAVVLLVAAWRGGF